MRRKSITVRNCGTGLRLCAGTWEHPLSFDEGKQLKEKLKWLLNQPIGYDCFEVLLPEDWGNESVIIDRKDAFNVYVELKKMFNN